MKNISLWALAVLVFTGCSSNVFEPKAVVGKRTLTAEYDKTISMQHLKGITYSDGKVVTGHGEIQKMVLPKGYAYINENEGYLIAADNGGSVMLINKETQKQETFVFAHRILSATLEGNLLAAVSSKNSMQLFDTAENKLIFKFASTEPLAVDIRLANPVFNKNLIFYPSLDGKVQIYSKDQNKMIRTMSISTEDKFNNIIFFKLFRTNIIAATGSSLYLFGKDIVKKELPIRSVLFEKESLLVIGKDGKVTRYGLDLEEQASMKLKFAHIIGAVESNNSIFLIESEEYMVKVSNDLSSYLVYNFAYDNEKIFSGKDRFYFSNGYFLPH